MKFLSSLLVSVLILTSGCALLVRPLKPGAARISGGGTNGLISEIKQPENPAQSAQQSFERITESDLPLAAGTKVMDGGKQITLTTATVQHTKIVERAGTVIGAAQKDMAREIGAKLSSMKGIMWAGVVVFLFGLATMFYPPLRAIIGSVTTSAAIIGGGLALIVLPTLIVGHEVLILGGVAAVVGIWFLAHRHGQLKGLLTSLTGSDNPTVTPATVTPTTSPAQPSAQDAITR